MRIGFCELLMILAIVLLFIGPKQLPKLTGAIKESVKEFKKGVEYKQESEGGGIDEAGKN